jgi:predicted RNA-binding protein YlxR (DUF448 family)
VAGRAERTCAICRAKRHPDDMFVRVALASDGTAAVGVRAPGRGAWLCSPTCATTATSRRGAWPRALRRPLGADAEAVLTSEITRVCGGPDGSDPAT